MADINEQQIAVYMKDRIADLKKQIAHYEKALTFFNGDELGSPKRLKRGSEPKDVAEQLSSTIKKKAKKAGKAIKKASIKLSVPDEFSSDLSRDKQIIYVLSKTPNLNAVDTAKEIASLLSVETDAKLERNVVQRLSVLKNLGQISAKRDGRTSYYSL